MEDAGLQWNEKKCAVVHVKRGCLQESPDARCGEQELVKSLKEDSQYKFRGVLENIRQEDNLTLENAARVSSENVCDTVESTIGLLQGSCKQPVSTTSTCILQRTQN